MIGEQLAFAFEGFESVGGGRRTPKPNEVGYWPYPKPCPWRDRCINYGYYLETGNSCSGECAWCTRGQVAAGREIPDWQLKLMSPYERHYLLGVVAGDQKELKAFKRCERAMERSYEQ